MFPRTNKTVPIIIPNKFAEVSCEKGGMRSFISYEIEFRKYLVPNPLDSEFVIPLYIRNEYDTLHIDYHNIEWAYYVMEFDHQKIKSGKWVLTNLTSSFQRRAAENRGYEHFGFPEFTVMYFIAFAHINKSSREILGGFTLVKNPKDVLEMPSRTVAHSDRIINFTRFCEYHPFDCKPNLVVHGKYMQSIYSFGYIYHKMLEGLVSMVNYNEGHKDYYDLGSRYQKLSLGELQCLLDTAVIVEGAYRGTAEEEHSYLIHLDSDYDPQNPLSAWQYLRRSEGGREPKDPYTKLLHDRQGILDTDKTPPSSLTTSEGTESEFSNLSLESFFDCDDLDLSIYQQSGDDDETQDPDCTLTSDELDI